MSNRTNAKKKIGAPPGSLIHVGARREEETQVDVIDYNPNVHEEDIPESLEALDKYTKDDTVSWINVTGLHDVSQIEEIGNRFQLHPLLLEDVLNTNQRPKLDEFDSLLFIVAKMIYTVKEGDETEIQSEQISFVVGREYVLTFQESRGDIFDPVRERIRKGRGRIRREGSDYLTYALLDAVVDQYFVIMERIADVSERIEDELIDEPDSELLQELHGLKRDLIFFRKSVWPLREVIARLERSEHELVASDTRIYLRDLYDHTIQVMDTIETIRDTVSGQLDIYLSSISNRMNEVMKTLTIIATIFIPLTFIAGVYGMNFEYMPELKWSWAYPAIMSLMGIVAFIMLLYFRKKDWI